MAEKRKDNKNRVLKTGESQRKNGTYEFKYKDATGKRKSAYAKTLKELRQKEEEIQKDNALGLAAVDRRTLFKDYAEKNIVSKCRNQESARAQERMKKLVVNSCLSNIPLGNIKVSDCQDFIRELDDKYSRRTTRGCIGMASQVLNLAEQDELIRKNPFSKFNPMSLVTKKEGKRDAVSDENFDGIVQLCKENKAWEPYVKHMIVLRETGLRINEYLGLRVQDVDFDNKTINVNHQLRVIYNSNGKKCFDRPKSEKSNRIIPMTNACYEALYSIYLDNKPYIFKGGDLDGLMILSKNHEPFNSNGIRKTFWSIKQAYIKKTGCDDFQFSPHCLRHSCATRMLKNGVNIKAVQSMLGHEDIETTLNIYAEISQTDFHADVLKKMDV